jgi:hypothetical protein
MLGGADENATAGHRAASRVGADDFELFDGSLRKRDFEASAQYCPFRLKIFSVKIRIDELGVAIAADRLMEQHFEDVLFHVAEGVNDEHRNAVRRFSRGMPVEPILIDGRGKLDELVKLGTNSVPENGDFLAVENIPIHWNAPSNYAQADANGGASSIASNRSPAS